jgi:hypothetical protein
MYANFSLSCNLLKINKLIWWRRGESKQIVVLKTRNLLIFRDAQNAKNSKNEPNWNVSGTQPQACQNESLVDLPYLCFVLDWRAVAR